VSPSTLRNAAEFLQRAPFGIKLNTHLADALARIATLWLDAWRILFLDAKGSLPPLVLALAVGGIFGATTMVDHDERGGLKF
jgi:hypothetical protein